MARYSWVSLAVGLVTLVVTPSVLMGDQDGVPPASPPRVLFWGDAIQRPVLQTTANELKGKVEIVFPRNVEPGDTGTALAGLDELIQSGFFEDFDLVYVNFGLADLMYRDPRTVEIRAMSRVAGGVRVTSRAEYRERLTRIVERLREANVAMVWAHTTPIVNAGSLRDLYEPGSEIEYNEIALEVMDEFAVPVIDLHGFATSELGDQKHPDLTGYHRAVPLHTPVVRFLEARFASGDR